MRYDRSAIKEELRQAQANAQEVEREEAQLWWDEKAESLREELAELDSFEAYLAAWHAQPHTHQHQEEDQKWFPRTASGHRIEAIGRPLTEGGPHIPIVEERNV